MPIRRSDLKELFRVAYRADAAYKKAYEEMMEIADGKNYKSIGDWAN